MTAYANIQPGGGDTAAPINLERRLRVILENVDLQGKSILDCGCGSGGYVTRFFDLSAHVHGIEHDEAKVREFRARGVRPDSVRQGDIERLEFPDAAFDFVLLNEVLEHVPDQRRALQEVCRVLKQDGILGVFSPNRLYPFETHGCSIKHTDISVPYYVPGIPYLPLSVGERVLDYHARNYFPSELRKELVEAGFDVRSHGFVWQTFEDISGSSPGLVRALSPLLRWLSLTLEKLPVVNRLGVSQVLFATKSAG